MLKRSFVYFKMALLLECNVMHNVVLQSTELNQLCIFLNNNLLEIDFTFFVSLKDPACQAASEEIFLLAIV